jgi:hypothetical protein
LAGGDRVNEQLSQYELNELRRMRERVHILLPDAVPFIRELAREGLITGWRNVVYVGPPRPVTGAIDARMYLANSEALRTKHGTVTDDVQ